MSAPAFALEPLGEGLFSGDPAGLAVGECARCSALSFPRRTVCPECQSQEVSERILSGGGEIFTFTIVRMAPPSYLGEAPYAIGVVELDEGLRVTSTLVAGNLESLEIGDRVDFTLLELGEGTDRVQSFAYRRAEG